MWPFKNKEEELAKKVKECFDGVEWKTQTFIYNGTKIEVDNEEEFYKAKPIKEAIDKLNKVLEAT